MGASQFLGMGTGAFNSLSRIQFGSTSLGGRDLNSTYKGPEIGVGEVGGTPLPLTHGTFGSANAAMAWRQHALMPLTNRTLGSTFRFDDPGSGVPSHVEPHMNEEQF